MRMKCPIALRRRARRALRSSSGSTTVEVALWLPVFALLTGLIADASLLLYSQTRLLDVARDASRQVALGVIDVSQVPTAVAGRMGWASSYQVNVVDEDGFVTTSMSVPYGAVTLFGERVFGQGALTAEFTMLREAVQTGDDDE